MEKITCLIHNINILIYRLEEENLFTDNDKQEVAIFYDGNGKKYLKRFILNQCDENCETIKQILGE